jgi:hypothetical protein
MAGDSVVPGRARSRWWEDYLVRYFTGTLVGTACVFILVTNIFFEGDTAAVSKRMFFSPEKDSTWLGLIALLLAGGAYCYLASVPITVFHAGRMIREGMNRWARIAWYIWWGLSFVIVLGAALDFTWLRHFPPSKLFVGTLLAICCGPAIWVFCGQLNVLWILKKKQDKPDAPFVAYYRSLVRARDQTATSGIRESYTHMREHANSVFIVVIELSLLAAFLLLWKLMVDPTLFAVWSLGFLMLWTSPNVLLWGLANSLERDLAANPSEYELTKE